MSHNADSIRIRKRGGMQNQKDGAFLPVFCFSGRIWKESEGTDLNAVLSNMVAVGIVTNMG